MTTAIVRKVDQYISDDRGATAVEYCVIACVIGLALLPSSNGLQAAIMGKFSEMNTWFK
jgi:Flp pilus assembly pilin Flp